jgi:hypothetical protein
MFSSQAIQLLDFVDTIIISGSITMAEIIFTFITIAALFWQLD